MRYEEGDQSLRSVLLAVTVTTFGVLPPFLTGALSIQIRDELNFGESALGLAIATFFASSALASAVAGRFIERIGSKRGIRVATAGSALSLLGLAFFARSWWELVFFLFIGGLANACSHPATHLLLARNIAAIHQGLAFGVKQAAIPCATLIGGLAVPLLGATLGWRWAFICGALVPTVLALTVKGSTQGSESDRSADRRAVKRLAPLIMLTIGMALGSAATVPLGAFVIESAVSQGLTAGTAGMLMASCSAVGITVRILCGWLAEQLPGGQLRFIFGMLIMGTVGFFLMATDISWLFVFGAVLAFGAGWGWHGLFNYAVVRSNREVPAVATGITQTGASGGSAVGPPAFGFMVEKISYGAAWTSAGVVALLSAAAMLTGWYMIRQASREPVK